MSEDMTGDYIVSNDKTLISVDSVCELLAGSYWAQDRDRKTIERSIENSLCWGVYHNGEQVGLARAVTDRATIYWLCDVIIGKEHRGKGLGKKLMEAVVNSSELKGLRAILGTKDAHGCTNNTDSHQWTDGLWRESSSAEAAAAAASECQKPI